MHMENKYVLCVEPGIQDMEVKDDEKHMWPDLAKPCEILKEISMLHSKSEEVMSKRECVDTHIRHLTKKRNSKTENHMCSNQQTARCKCEWDPYSQHPTIMLK